MYAGSIVEEGSVDQLFSAPRHPYTRGLFDAIPSISGPRRRLVPIQGMVPAPGKLPRGCAFAPRCGQALDTCQVSPPALQPTSHGRQLACSNPIVAADAPLMVAAQ
jgi:peptide/nickel transport system ATP-binding protein